MVTLAQSVDAHTQAQRRAAAALATRRRRLDDLITQGKTTGKIFARVAVEHQQVLVLAEACTRGATKARAALDKLVARRAAIAERAVDIAARRKHLDPQRTIRQLDVAQETILTATKLTAVQLISFALREYLPTMPMTPQTFLQRVLSISGRKEIRDDQELVVFYENPRDALVNDALRDACLRLNRRALRREDRRLRFAVEQPPGPGRLI